MIECPVCGSELCEAERDNPRPTPAKLRCQAMWFDDPRTPLVVVKLRSRLFTAGFLLRMLAEELEKE